MTLRYKVPKKLGEVTHYFDVEGDDLFDVLMQAEKLSFNDVKDCGLCGGRYLYFKAYHAGESNEYNYAKVVCVLCGGSVTFGKTKKGETWFLRRVKEGKNKGQLDWQAKKGDDSTSAPAPNNTKPTKQETDEDDVPF